MHMTWAVYCNILNPLIQKFGAVHYSQETIRQGYFYWKSKPKEVLIDEISRSIAFNVPFELIKPVDNTKRPERTKWQPEEYHQTVGALEFFLKSNGVNSLIELLDKERNRIRSEIPKKSF